MDDKPTDPEKINPEILFDYNRTEIPEIRLPENKYAAMLRKLHDPEFTGFINDREFSKIYEGWIPNKRKPESLKDVVNQPKPQDEAAQEALERLAREVERAFPPDELKQLRKPDTPRGENPYFLPMIISEITETAYDRFLMRPDESDEEYFSRIDRELSINPLPASKPYDPDTPFSIHGAFAPIRKIPDIKEPRINTEFKRIEKSYPVEPDTIETRMMEMNDKVARDEEIESELRKRLQKPDSDKSA